MTGPPPPIPPPGAFLRQVDDGPITAEGHLWGFGGLHGGLTLAVLATAMRQHAPDATRLRSATIRLHRPLTEAFTVKTTTVRSGRVTTLAAHASNGGVTHAAASAIFGAERPASFPTVAPAPPAASSPSACEPFVVPPEFVPISAYTEIRPIGPNRPYAGGADAELTAWVRLTEDDQPPDAYRLILLMDALAPSYAAVLTDLQPIPTIELTVHPGPGLQHTCSPWVLLHARTGSAGTDGWSNEQIDAWDPSGVHLGTAHQLRLARSSTPP
jgi:Thioesterase-like superfamily